MKVTIQLIFLSLIFTIQTVLVKAQCSTGCTFTVTSSTATNYTVNAGEKLCINATSGNITLSGTISLKKSGSIEICTGTNDTVIFTGTYGEPSPGGGDRTFTNYGNIYFNHSDATGWRPFRSNVVNEGYIKTRLGYQVYYGLVNNGTIDIGGQLELFSNANVSNTGTINVGAGMNTNSSATFVNSGTWNVTLDAPFNGNYTNSGTFNVGGTLTINASGTVNIEGGIFYSTNLIFNSGVVNAGATGCAAFIVSDYTNINSNTFMVGSGVVDVTDLNNPGTVNANTCPAGPPDNCGLTFSGAISSNSCLSTLPVHVMSFKGEYLNESQVELNWITINEKDNLNFILERTEDMLTYKPIYTINSVGMSSQVKKYSYVDNVPDKYTDYYYRLRNKDIDGALHNHGIIFPDRPKNELVISVYPNPNKGQFSINIDGRSAIRHIRILDAEGKIIHDQNSIPEGTKVFDFNLRNSKGLFVLMVATNEDLYYQKITIE